MDSPIERYAYGMPATEGYVHIRNSLPSVRVI